MANMVGLSLAQYEYAAPARVCVVQGDGIACHVEPLSTEVIRLPLSCAASRNWWGVFRGVGAKKLILWVRFIWFHLFVSNRRQSELPAAASVK